MEDHMQIGAFLKRFISLMFGLYIATIGILLTIYSNLGAGPWDTFHLGIIKHVNLSLGQVSQLIGICIIFADIVLKQFPGWGTIANMYFIGYFIDLNDSLGFIPVAESLVGRTLMLLFGIIILSLGSFFYLNAGWGAGPRDGLMIGLSKRVSSEVWKTRTAIEVCVTFFGFLLGAKLGIGTIVLAFLVGPAIQVVYRIGGKDLKKIEHRTLVDDYRWLLSLKEKTIAQS